MTMTSGQILEFVLEREVLSLQVRQIENALDNAGIGSNGLHLDDVAGEVIRRDIFGELSAMGVQFGTGCSWFVSSAGGITLKIDVIHARDLIVVKSVIADWKPSVP